MNKNKIINFEPKERLIEKVGFYTDSLELFLEERDKAVPLLLKALKHADRKLRRKIIFLLGSFAKQEAIKILKKIRTGPAYSA